MENRVSYPWPSIVFVGGREKLENQVFCDVVSNSKFIDFTKSICELITKRSVSLPTNINGWFLILQTSSDQPYLWNAITLMSIDLPPLNTPEYDIDYAFLTKSPNDCNCMVLLLMEKPRGIQYCYTNGDGDWTFRDNQEELLDFRGGYDHICDKFVYPVAIDDDKMIMTSYSKVVAKIEIVEPKRLIIKPYPLVVVSRTNDLPMYWVACCGDLFVIYVKYGGHLGKHIVSFDVFKFDFIDVSWKKVESCPNVAFFIRGWQIMACPISSTDSIKVGNQIYIVKYEKNEEGEEGEEYEEVRLLLHSYHIQQKTQKTSLIATSKNESEPYWVLLSDAQTLAKAEEDYRNGGYGNNDQLFVKRENTVVHNNYEHEENKFSITLEDLPIDILKIISSHLTYLSDYLNFRATSKNFRDTFSKKEWRDMRASESDISLYPWLIFPNYQQVDKDVFSMVDLVSRNKYNVGTYETLEENFRICYSTNGWLLMSSPYFEDNKVKGFNLFFYNPITKSTVCLPKLPAYDASHFLFIGLPDYQEACIIIGVSRYMTSNQEFGECPDYYIIYKEPGNDEWGEWESGGLTIEHGGGYFRVQQSNVNVVLVGGVFYFLVGDGNIAHISYKNRTLGIHNLEEPCRKSSYEHCFLAEYDEDLLSVYIGREWKWLKVFMFNESDMIWDEVNELKGKNLYLSCVSSTVLEPQSPKVGNRIYSLDFTKAQSFIILLTQRNFT